MNGDRPQRERVPPAILPSILIHLLLILPLGLLLMPVNVPAQEAPGISGKAVRAEGRLLVKIRSSWLAGREIVLQEQTTAAAAEQAGEWARLFDVRSVSSLFAPPHPSETKLSRSNPEPAYSPFPSVHENPEVIAALGKHHGLDRWVLLELHESEQVEEALARLARDPRVEVVEPDYQGRAAAYFPGDPSFTLQWYLDQASDADIDMPEAWEIARNAENVPVAVLDSGVQLDHPDLRGVILPGWDYVNSDSVPADDNGHGTHVTGLIAARSDNAEGIAGTAFQARVMPLKVLNADLTGFYSDWAAAFYHCVFYGVRVANLSAGGSSPSTYLHDAIRFAHERGVVIFAAMMNYGDDLPRYPAFYEETIAVGATDQFDRRADPFGSGGSDASSYGAHIDLTAPGDGLISTYINSRYVIGWGTSQATPLVSAVAALMLSLDPDMTPGEVRSVLQATADDGVGTPGEDTPGFDIYHGWGRLNAEAALAATVGNSTTPTLSQVYPPRPNPSPGPVSFRYDLDVSGLVTIRIRDIRGRLVHSLLDQAVRTSGTHLETWDGRDAGGVMVPAGVYLYEMILNGRRITGKLIRF
ncbi:S8 family serine peptidase [Gemmatimonadota bacterium]